MSGIIDPTARTPGGILLDVHGNVISETRTVRRCRVVRLDDAGQPDGPGVEADVSFITTRYGEPVSPSPCVQPLPAVKHQQVTLDLEWCPPPGQLWRAR